MMKEKIMASVSAFHLPSYEDIPDVGLYLEQTAKYINSFLGSLGGLELTTSMISNYVKQGLIDSPVKKQYGAEQIAYLFFIAVAKAVLSMDNLRLLVAIQRRSYSVADAYNYFCKEMENIIGYVFTRRELEPMADEFATDEKIILRNTIIAVAHKIYLDKYLQAVMEQVAEEQ